MAALACRTRSRASSCSCTHGTKMAHFAALARFQLFVEGEADGGDGEGAVKGGFPFRRGPGRQNLLPSGWSQMSPSRLAMAVGWMRLDVSQRQIAGWRGWPARTGSVTQARSEP